MPAPAKSSLQSRLAAALPVGVDIKAYHISTTPSSTSALFAPPPGEREEKTLCESHFLAVSSPPDGDKNEVLVYAVEILIFTSPSLTTLFVSKADSSGFSSRLNPPKGSPSVVGSIISTYVEFLLEPRLTRSRVLVSLFARSQNQYLFPGSIENVSKHVLDDRQLIKWWCRILDNVLRLRNDGGSSPCKATAHVVVPGCDKAETKAFFPPSSRLDPPADPKWINSYPVELLVPDTSKPPRHLIPRLPDDPKSRFLDDLDGDFVGEHGQWRGVKTLDQFWEMMSYRQECAAGRLVGFLWLVFSPGQFAHASLHSLENTVQPGELSEPSRQTQPLTPLSSQLRGAHDSNFELQPKPKPDAAGEFKSPTPSSPIARPQTDPGVVAALDDRPDNDLLATDSASTEQAASAINIDYARETQGEIVVNADQYQSLLDHLLQSDFAGEDVAAESTRSWVQKALQLSGAATFGRRIRGEHSLASTNGPEQRGTQQVNVLTGVRKKRKADTDVEAGPAASGQTAINILPAGLVRKKAKT